MFLFIYSVLNKDLPLFGVTRVPILLSRTSYRPLHTPFRPRFRDTVSYRRQRFLETSPVTDPFSSVSSFSLPEQPRISMSPKVTFTLPFLHHPKLSSYCNRRYPNWPKETDDTTPFGNSLFCVLSSSFWYFSRTLLDSVFTLVKFGQ